MTKANTAEQKEISLQNADLRKRRNHYKKQRFLKELALTSNVQASTRKAGILPATVYDWRRKDSAFREAWAEALEAGYDMLEMTMLERFRNGTERKIYHRGEHIATEQEFDSALAIRLLAAHRDAVTLQRATTAKANANNIILDNRASERLNQKLDDMRQRLLFRKNPVIVNVQPQQLPDGAKRRSCE